MMQRQLGKIYILVHPFIETGNIGITKESKKTIERTVGRIYRLWRKKIDKISKEPNTVLVLGKVETGSALGDELNTRIVEHATRMLGADRVIGMRVLDASLLETELVRRNYKIHDRTMLESFGEFANPEGNETGCVNEWHETIRKKLRLRRENCSINFGLSAHFSRPLNEVQRAMHEHSPYYSKFARKRPKRKICL